MGNAVGASAVQRRSTEPDPLPRQRTGKFYEGLTVRGGDPGRGPTSARRQTGSNGFGLESGNETDGPAGRSSDSTKYLHEEGVDGRTVGPFPYAALFRGRRFSVRAPARRDRAAPDPQSTGPTSCEGMDWRV